MPPKVDKFINDNCLNFQLVDLDEDEQETLEGSLMVDRETLEIMMNLGEEILDNSEVEHLLPDGRVREMNDIILILNYLRREINESRINEMNSSDS